MPATPTHQRATAVLRDKGSLQGSALVLNSASWPAPLVWQPPRAPVVLASLHPPMQEQLAHEVCGYSGNLLACRCSLHLNLQL
jgi:hypothetical protein